MEAAATDAAAAAQMLDAGVNDVRRGLELGLWSSEMGVGLKLSQRWMGWHFVAAAATGPQDP